MVSQWASVSRMPPARASAMACTLSSVGSAAPGSVWAMIRTRLSRMGNSRNVPSSEKKVCIDSARVAGLGLHVGDQERLALNEPSSLRPIWARTVLWLPSAPTT